MNTEDKESKIIAFGAKIKEEKIEPLSNLELSNKLYRNTHIPIISLIATVLFTVVAGIFSLPLMLAGVAGVVKSFTSGLKLEALYNESIEVSIKRTQLVKMFNEKSGRDVLAMDNVKSVLNSHNFESGSRLKTNKVGEHMIQATVVLETKNGSEKITLTECASNFNEAMRKKKLPQAVMSTIRSKLSLAV